jgi:hypothetical protein
VEEDSIVIRRINKRSVTAVAWVVSATVITTLALSAQTAGSPSIGGPSTFLNSLSAYAQRADSSPGDVNYATELIRMMASHVSRDDVAVLARRLASADQAARHDPGRYVAETAVAAAFNRFMAQVQGRDALSFRTDALVVHRMRLVLAGNSTSLTSIKKHPTSCLPDEAVLLMILLRYNNGTVVFVPRGQPPPPLGESMRVENAAKDAGLRVNQYLAEHSKATNMALFSRLLHDMGI